MKVSVITTCYNRAKTIRSSIESVLSQDYPNIEYIIIDGASTDGSVEIIQEYKEKLTTFISEPDHGMYEAINKGIRAATGDIIGLIHSDDEYYDTHVISRIVKAFKAHKPDMVYGNGIFVIPDSPQHIVRTWISGPKKRHLFRRGWLPLHTTTYFRKEILDKYGLYDETFRIAADSELLTRYMYKHKIKTHYLNNYLVKMKIGGASTSIRKTLVKWAEDVRVYRHHDLNPYIALPAKVLFKIPQLIVINKKILN